jgi:formylglycine-generating enzyme required for sulfatase activity/serine/threonine protein kinase
MGATAAVHPPDEILQSFGLGKLDEFSSESVGKHVELCDSCQRRVAELSSDEFLGRLQQARGKPDSSVPGWLPSAASSTEESSNALVPPPQADTLPPELVDHADYEVVRELGRGGMGVVYLVKNRLMGRLEVLKIIGRHLVERPGVVDRFLREIRSAAKLQHPNIVTAYTAMRLGEGLALAMEYVDGLDLAKLVKTKGALPIAHACYFIHQAALGLQHAHERGMVHRDIKPANLILARDGKKAMVKVLDFGLAKVTSEGQSDSNLTREGQMLGTPDYIAPEQIRNAQSADIRADIYSLGCTFYYLLSGGPPFRGDHLWDVYQAHFSMDAGPLNLVRPEVPVELAAVVAKMMAKEPERRFQTPGELAQALTPFFKKSNEGARTSSSEMSAPGRPEEKVGAASLDQRSTLPGNSTTPAPVKAVNKPAEAIAAHVEAGTQPAAVAAARQRHKARWLRPAVAAAVLLVGCAIAYGLIVKWKTPNGVIEFVDLPTDAEVLIDGERATLKMPRDGKHPVFTVIAGNHKVTVRKDGLAMPAETVTVEAGDKAPFTVRLAALPDRSKELPKDRGALEPTRTANKDARPSPEPAAQPSTSTPSLPPSFSNSIGMTLKQIPAGEFMMGSPDADAEATKDEKPEHPVRISAFYMGIHEVTQAQYQAIMGINPSYFSANGGGKNQVAGRPTDQYPVEYLTWLDAVRFCNALSVRDGLLPFYEINGEAAENVEIPNKKGLGYRLATEAEWEYACRAGTKTKYSFGDDAALLNDYGWFDQNSVRMTHAVGEKRPNAFGLYDMHGNVWEICGDVYDENYYKHSSADDPFKLSGTGAQVIRGGSWRRLPQSSRSSMRVGYTPIGREPDLGFRVALNLTSHVIALANSAKTEAAQRPSLSTDEPKLAIKPNTDMLSESTRMAFALITAGEFMMGSRDDDVVANPWEKPPHKVRLSPFFLGNYEVTQAQYTAVAGTNPSFFSSTGGGREMVAGQPTDDYPVERVSWLDAIKFCNLLSTKDKLYPYYKLKGDKVEIPDSKGAGYRLPTDAEWEHACRAGTKTTYAFGNDAWILAANAWTGGSSGGIVHTVGRKRPNVFGIYDMHGNVWEWCADWADGAYYKGAPTDDPPGVSKGTHRVMRGGCWRSGPHECRSANLSWAEPTGGWETVGFRVARGLTAPELESARRASPVAASPESVKLAHELIKNPGCEELTTDGKIASWEVKEGTWTRESKDQPPFEGSFFFSPGSVPEAELLQDVDVSHLAQSIDKRTQSFAFAAHVRTWDQAPADTTRVVVEFLDSGKANHLVQFDSGPVASVGVWRSLEWTKVAPVNTRWIRIRLISHRQSGAANDGVYDGLSLKAVTPPADPVAIAAPGTPNKLAPALPKPLAKGLPEELLKARGLIRSGAYFVVASEREALEKFDRLSPLISQLSQACRKYAWAREVEANLAVAQENLNLAQSALDAANTVLSKMPNGRSDDSQKKEAYAFQQSYCAGLTADRDAYSADVVALRAQQPPPGVKEELAKAYTARWAEFREAGPPVALMLDKAKEEHRRLQADPAVREALAAIRRSTKAEVSLSSPKNLQNAIDAIRTTATVCSPEASAPKKKPKSKSARPSTKPKK